LIFLLFLTGLPLACETEGTFERAGEDVDEALEETGEEIEEAGDEIEEELD
jgi:hypothetical protein